MMSIPLDQRTWEAAVWKGESASVEVLARGLVEGGKMRKKEGKGKVLFARIQEEV